MLVTLGFREDGRPIWSYSGGSEGPPENSATEDGGDDEQTGDTDSLDETQLTDKVQRLIDRERADAKRARDAARPWISLARSLGVRGPDEVRSRLEALTREQSESAAAIDTARADALSKANARIVKAEIKAAAADLFADPSDAVLHLRPEDYEVDDNGDIVDEKTLKRDLADLLRRKPHLKKVSSKVDFEGGPRRTAEGPVDMNERIRSLARPGR